MDSRTSQVPVEADGEPRGPPPPYSGPASHTAASDTANNTFPGYEASSSSQSAPGGPVPLAPYRGFPLSMSGHGTWSISGFKYFHLCGEGPKDRLYIVETHLSSTSKAGGPLGNRPGLILRNGVEKKDPILAATGDESQYPVGFHELATLNGVVCLPTAGGKFRTEVVQTELSKTRGVVFRFQADRQDEMGSWREDMEWVKFEKGSDGEYSHGGYRLFRRQGANGASISAGEGSSKGEVAQAQAPCDALAVVSWPGNLITSGTHYLNLKFSKAVEAEGLGDQWTLLVVMTALRIMNLRMVGRTSSSMVKYGEKEY